MSQLVQEEKSHRHIYIIGSVSLLLTIILAIATVYYWKEIRASLSYYGYAGGFVVSILGGIAVIPAPSLLIVFTLGHALNPFFVGLIAGLGEAMGGITTYLTGAGFGSIFSRLNPHGATDSGYHPIPATFRMRAQTFYNRVSRWAEGRGSAWTVFITSALVFSPYYFAGIAAGTLRIGLWRFFLLSWAGKTVKGMMVAFAGYYGISLLLKLFGG
ncbi:MAG: VTT domain-containing protein [Chloroflexota bacterium]